MKSTCPPLRFVGVNGQLLRRDEGSGVSKVIRRQINALAPLGPEHDGRFQPGDAVFFAGNVARAGCQRQFTLVDSRLVGRRPRRLSAAEAAALPLTTLTVWEGMLDRQGIPERWISGR